MQDKVIVFSDEEGIKIVHPAPEMFDPESRTRLLLANNGTIFATEQDIMEFIVGKSLKGTVEYKILDRSSIPQDRYFRNAWMLVGEAVGVDIVKAQDIQKDALRELRKPKLEALDVEFMKSIELGKSADTEAIIQQKTYLRDITSLEMPTDLEALKNFIPEGLK